MGHFFSPYQIAQIAVEVEEIGAEFYRRLAELNINESVQEACRVLAEEEVAHRDAFLEIAKGEEGRTDFENFGMNLVAGMQMVLDRIKGGIFKMKTVDAVTASPKEFLMAAAKVEEDLINLYEELYLILKPEDRETLGMIIAEEKKHLFILVNVQQKLNFV